MEDLLLVVLLWWLSCSCWRASSSQNQDSSINSGLNLNIKTQNSIWVSAPSPSRSPSLIMLTSSSSFKSCSPKSAAFSLKLSNVITPFSLSTSSSNPLQSSFISPSPPSLVAMTGSKSSKAIPAIVKKKRIMGWSELLEECDVKLILCGLFICVFREGNEWEKRGEEGLKEGEEGM